jgi:hypothetical protein
LSILAARRAAAREIPAGDHGGNGKCQLSPSLFGWLGKEFPSHFAPLSSENEWLIVKFPGRRIYYLNT